jgi:ubiquitin carboxyl-terminal hydrolase 25
LLEFAYQEQLRCGPVFAPDYLDTLTKISELPGLPDSDHLFNLVQIERSKGFWSSTDLHKGARLLGFGEDGAMRIPFDSDVDENFLINAFQNAWRDADSTYRHDSERRDAHRQELKEALKMACQFSGNPELVARYEQEVRIRTMDPSRAYGVFGATGDIDDEMLLVVYSMRVSSDIIIFEAENFNSFYY